jgi:hypothetical protein
MEGVFATQVEPLKPCRPSDRSFFELVESIWSGPNFQPLRRFCSLMRKMNAASFVQEQLVLNQELIDEKEMACSCFNEQIELEAKRWTFFCYLPESLDWNDESLLDQHILGYAVIVYLKRPNGTVITFLLEAVVRRPSVVYAIKGNEFFIEPITNYYIHNIRKFPTTIGTEELNGTFTIEGSFFTQQNCYTSVCAHACLRMAINSSPFLESQKLTNKKINDVLGIENYDASSGLAKEQIEKVVETMGYRFHSANFLERTDIEYDHFLYPALESRFPTILGVEYWDEEKRRIAGHVVTVLGHTINSDRWEPEARRGYGSLPIQPYIPSAEWCDHYVISDDNYGMYSTLPSDAVRNFIVPTKNPNRHVSMAISILPEKVVLWGYFAEQLAISFAKRLISSVSIDPPNNWLNRMKHRLTNQKEGLVCRTLLQKGKDYHSYINEYIRNPTPKQKACLDSLPDFVWVSEISIPNIYTVNKHKLGDVVIRANATRKEHTKGENLVLAWFPGFVQIGHKRDIQPWGITNHIPLIRTEERSVLEW